MAWWEKAQKMELQPESDAQPAIRPTQLIFHSMAAPWNEQRLLEHWKTTTLESHFGVDYDGSVGQYIGTETRADANAEANRRADGSGAVSVETASKTDSSDPWTPKQVKTLVALGVWMHQRHGLPLKICQTWDEPGFGYHSMFPEWSVGGTDCPGAARITQFRTTLFPAIVARAADWDPTEPEETDMPTPAEYAKAVWEYGIPNRFRLGSDGKPRTIPALYYQEWSDSHFDDLLAAIKAASAPELTEEQLAALASRIAAEPTLAKRIAELVADQLAARLAS